MFLFLVSSKSQDLFEPYKNFTPSSKSLDFADVKPSDIPSEQVLRKMGFTNEEILEALSFKYQTGKYNSLNDSLKNIESSSETFMNKMDIKNVDDNDSISFPQAKIYGQDLFRNNNLDYFLKANDANPPNNYKLGSGDQLNIAVWGNSDYSQISTIDERGYISLDGFGRVYLKGLTFKNAKSLIQKRLGMGRSQMDITIIYSRVITVNIVGEVYSPGSYSIPAINTAFNALIAANGPTQIGSVRNIFIKRNGEIVDTLDVYKFLYDPLKSNDIFLQDGDYIVVAPASNLVELKGQVNRPYTYEVTPKDMVSDLIKFSGGYTDFAYSKVLTLKRYNPELNNFIIDDVHESDIEITKLDNVHEIMVNKISEKINNYVTFVGSGGIEGSYEFVKGDKILDLMITASCIDSKVNDNDRLFDIGYLLRINKITGETDYIKINITELLESKKGNILLEEFDVLYIQSKEVINDFYIDIYGSVLNIGRYSYGDRFMLQDLINLSGGILSEAAGSRIEVIRFTEKIDGSFVPVERNMAISGKINNNLSLDTLIKNFVLYPFDQIFVRKNPAYKQPANISITGEVYYPGSYSLLSEGDKLSSIISKAGGLTDYAFIEGARLYRVNKFVEKEVDGEMISPDFANVILSQPELFKRYRNKLVNSQLNSMTLESSEVTELSIVAFDLNKALSSKNSKHNIVLEDGDSIVIPKSSNIVYITGELNNYEGRGISAPYFTSKRANYYINNFAGGYSKQSDRFNTTVTYPNGSVKKSINFGMFALSPKVTEGSVINLKNIDEKPNKSIIPIDWNAAIENTMIKVTGMLSLYLLIDRIRGSY